MPELELVRSAGDRRRYEVEGVGALQLGGPFSRSATAEADATAWTFRRTGFWQRTVEATDAIDNVVGSFAPRKMKRGGGLVWGGRELGRGRASRWKERYALADGDRELAVFEGKGWGKRPVKITVDDPAPVEPGLLLFAVFVVRGLAEDAGAAASAASAGAA